MSQWAMVTSMLERHVFEVSLPEQFSAVPHITKGPCLNCH
jgi:hypothetical protein